MHPRSLYNQLVELSIILFVYIFNIISFLLSISNDVENLYMSKHNDVWYDLESTQPNWNSHSILKFPILFKSICSVVNWLFK